ncbi:MAG: thioredoxin domain-containing protein [bacterium]
MPCIFALLVFGILSIFSASYRPLAKEAFRCVFRRLTFRPCDTPVGDRLKASVVSWGLRKSLTAGTMISKSFTVLSWLFVFLFFYSLFWIGIGTVNYYRFGTCSPDNPIACPINATTCGVPLPWYQRLGLAVKNVFSPPSVDPKISWEEIKGNVTHFTGDTESKLTIVEFVDYACVACAKASDILRELLEAYTGKLRVGFAHFPLPQHPNAKRAAVVAEAAGRQGKFWEMSQLLFANQADWSYGEQKELFLKYAGELKLDIKRFARDLDDPSLLKIVEDNHAMGERAGVFGTPTLVANGKFYFKLITKENLEQLLR